MTTEPMTIECEIDQLDVACEHLEQMIFTLPDDLDLQESFITHFMGFDPYSWGKQSEDTLRQCLVEYNELLVAIVYDAY